MRPSRFSGHTAARAEERPLDSWKEIARYLGRSVRTAQTWEKQEGLPVHRHRHRRGSTVYAYPSEIDSWREGRDELARDRPGVSRRRLRGFWLSTLLSATAAIAATLSR